MAKKEKKITKLDILGWTGAYRNCLFWFFDYPDIEISLNDLSDNLGIAKTTARKVVLQLEEENFLIRKELGRVWRISCNKEHPYNHTVKIYYHAEFIHMSGIIEEIYKKVPNARAIVLFGSYRKGDDTEKSDVDIAVEVLGDKEIKIVELGKMNIGYREGVTVNLHIFSRNKIDLNLFSNIANGIVLDGFLEVKP